MNARNLGHNGGPELENERAGNWFAVSREIFTHSIVGIRNRPYTELEAWLSLLAMAEYGTRRALNKGTVIVLDPGQLMAAHSYLARRWDWPVGKVRWFMQRLQTEAMVTRYCSNQRDNRYSNQIQIITICNYAKYQLIEAVEQQAEQQAEPQANNKPTTSAQQANNKNLTLKHTNTPTLEDSLSRESEVVDVEVEEVLTSPRQKQDHYTALQAFNAYNDLAQRIGLPMVRTLTPARKKSLMARLREHGGLPAWTTALANIEKSAFLRGSGPAGWVADFDFMLKASKFAKLVDGGYGNGAHAQKPKETELELLTRLAGCNLDETTRRTIR